MPSSWLGDSYCITLARDLPPDEVLPRLGGTAVIPLTLDDAIAREGSFDAGYPRMATVATAGRWSVVLEVRGIEGSRPEVLRALSRDTEVYSAFGTVNSAIVSYAVDGDLVAAFDPEAPDRRWGLDPDRLAESIGDRGAVDPLAFVEERTGVVLSRRLFAGTLASAAIIPLLDDPPRTLTNHVVRQCDPDLAASIDGARPEVQRRVASAEARWWAESAGVVDDPLVGQALARAAAGGSGLVTDDSPLGLLIRSWCNNAHIAAVASADPRATGRLAPDARERAFRLATAGQIVRAALFLDSAVACYEVLRELPVNPDPALAQRRAVVMGTLR